MPHYLLWSTYFLLIWKILLFMFTVYQVSLCCDHYSHLSIRQSRHNGSLVCLLGRYTLHPVTSRHLINHKSLIIECLTTRTTKKLKYLEQLHRFCRKSGIIMYLKIIQYKFLLKTSLPIRRLIDSIYKLSSSNKNQQ